MRVVVLLGGLAVMTILAACDSPGLVRRGDPQTVLDALAPGMQVQPEQSALNPDGTPIQLPAD